MLDITIPNLIYPTYIQYSICNLTALFRHEGVGMGYLYPIFDMQFDRFISSCRSWHGHLLRLGLVQSAETFRQKAKYSDWHHCSWIQPRELRW